MKLHLYDSFFRDLATRQIDLLGTVQVVLVDKSYEFDAKHQKLADIRGVVPGGTQTLSNQTITDRAFKADSVVWDHPSLRLRAWGAVLCAWDRLIGFID